MNKDYYAILGVDKKASQEDIKKSFRQLARKYHPDANPTDKKQAEEKCKEISEAYEVLSDPEKRSVYDRTGSVDFGSGRTDFNWQDFTHYSDFQDIFDRIFGGNFGDSFFGGFRNQGPDLDLAVRVKVSLEDIYYGSTKNIKFRHNTRCEACEGTGAQGGVQTRCPTCNGTGQERVVQGQGFFRMVTVTTCRKCNGRGQIPREPCSVCKGYGSLAKTEILELSVPKGAPNNLKIRYKGKGQSQNGRTGDLFVILNVTEEPGIARSGDDLYIEQEISFPEAALGTEREIQIFRDKYVLKIPSGTQPGEIIKIKGAGFYHMNSNNRGDVNAMIKLYVPKKLSSRQKEILEEFMGQGDRKRSWMHR